jgi:L,D-peptidoglycan transpeptidase YkuD (ErfK/YbiS/YcfS/YnhG family)
VRTRMAGLLGACLAVALLVGPPAAPAPSSGEPTHRIHLDGVPVDLRDHTRQVITTRQTGTTTARVTLWALRYGTWKLVERTTVARIGYAGLVAPDQRRQGSGTTPTGTYYLPFTFGPYARHSDWTMPYRQFDGDDYWVLDNASAYYNRWRDRDAGGFRWALTDSSNGSERLADYTSQYRMAAVIAYNYYAPVRHRGGAIFLHVNGPGATAGCVSVPLWFMRSVMSRLDPTQKPVIAIGRR